MAATLGGGWDALLGRGLRWTITASSDSHGHWTDGGADFWPGEYSKTWVHAEPTPAGILEGLRMGRVFVATGGLVDRLDVSVAPTPEPAASPVAIGDVASATPGAELTVTVRFRPSSEPNAGGEVPVVNHVDLIAGETRGATGDRNPTTHVVRRFTAADWRQEGDMIVMEHRMAMPQQGTYLRVRGTSTGEAEPLPDTPGEDPWRDLWFYSNALSFQPSS